MDTSIVIRIAIVLFAASCIRGGYVRVKTKVGEIVGFEDKWKGRTVNKFFGIPYAEAPVGKRRFAKPVPKAPFKEPYSATRFGNACPQNVNMMYGLWYQRETIRFNTSEECLSLNIFAPVQGEKLKPVMIWIHGGGFVFGTAPQYDATKMAAIGETVIVTINYRLSVLGFYTTSDSKARGNYALLDQQAAFKWVQKNIERFGGDKSRVTIFGSSTGSVAVTWHMLAPDNQGLFQRAIAQGGAAPTFWPSPNPVHGKMYYSEVIPKKLGCAKGSSKTVLACLRKIPVEKFQDPNNPNWPFSQELRGSVVSGPIADGSFIPHWPHERKPGKRMEDQEVFKKVDLLIGFNKYQGSPLLQAFLENFHKAGSNRSIYEDGVTKKMFDLYATYLGTVESDEIKEALWGSYSTPGNNKTAEKMDPKRMLSFLGDSLFVSRIIQYLQRRLSDGVKGATYMYNFLPKISEEFGGLGTFLKTEPWIDGAIHEDEVGYLMGNSADVGRETRLASEQTEMSDTLIRLWTNFAKTGDPNKPTPVNTVWPQYKKAEEKYLELDIKEKKVNLSVNAFYRQRDMNFWLDVIPLLQRQLTEKKGTKKTKDEPRVSKDKHDDVKDEL